MPPSSVSPSISTSSSSSSLVGIFTGLTFVIELGLISIKMKREIQSTITQNGGMVEFAASKKTTHVITNPQLLDSMKIQLAQKSGCSIVKEEFIADSLNNGSKCDEEPYLLLEHLVNIWAPKVDAQKGLKTKEKLPSTPFKAEPKILVYKERVIKSQQEDEERRKVREAQRLEILEKRKKDEEERKIRAAEIRNAREAQILEERKKRGELLEKLKQKPTTHLFDYLQKVDEEEEQRKIEEEREQIEKQKEKQAEVEKKRKEEEEKRAGLKEEKRRVREEKEMKEREEKLAAKAERGKRYLHKKKIEDALQKQLAEERRKKRLLEFQERERKRELKRILGVPVEPVIQKDYDKCKIFVGGIDLDDLTPEKLGKKYSLIRDSRVNNLLKIFDQFGDVTKRKVFIEKKHCFITYETPDMAKKALETMQNFEERKKAVAEIVASLTNEKKNILAAPRTNFYVREPNTEKKKKTDSGEDEDTEED